MAREIPQGEWQDFLTDFTTDNEGRKAIIEVGDQRIGDSEGEDAFVLTGVEAGVQAEDDDTVVVALADLEGKEQGRVSHRFEDVTSLRVQEHEDKVEGLEIEMRGGTRAVVHLGEGTQWRE